MAGLLKGSLTNAFTIATVGGAVALGGWVLPDLLGNWTEGLQDSASPRHRAMGAIAALDPTFLAIGLGIVSFLMIQAINKNSAPGPSAG